MVYDIDPIVFGGLGEGIVRDDGTSYVFADVRLFDLGRLLESGDGQRVFDSDVLDIGVGLIAVNAKTPFGKRWRTRRRWPIR